VFSPLGAGWCDADEYDELMRKAGVSKYVRQWLVERQSDRASDAS
jgi:hypothetical protein